jgi:hypothetical protein
LDNCRTKTSSNITLSVTNKAFTSNKNLQTPFIFRCPEDLRVIRYGIRGSISSLNDIARHIAICCQINGRAIP